jgi:hypothetical protein
MRHFFFWRVTVHLFKQLGEWNVCLVWSSETVGLEGVCIVMCEVQRERKDHSWLIHSFSSWLLQCNEGEFPRCHHVFSSYSCTHTVFLLAWLPWNCLIRLPSRSLSRSNSIQDPSLRHNIKDYFDRYHACPFFVGSHTFQSTTPRAILHWLLLI